MSSCGSEYTAVDVSNANNPNTSVINKLACYNANLKVSHTRAKGNLNLWDWLSVSSADIIGAANGAAAGAKVGGETGAIICGVLTGAAASYEKYMLIKAKLGPGVANEGGDVIHKSSQKRRLIGMHVTDNPTTPDTIDSGRNTISVETMATVLSSQSAQDAEESESINLEYPAEYAEVATQIAVLHNEVLTILDSIGEENIIVDSSAFSADMQEYINNPEFFNSYDSIIVNAINYNNIEAQNEVDIIIRLFLDAVSEVDTLEEITAIANDYIGIIEESTTLTTEQKQILYTAFAVSAYSFEYWSKYKEM